MSNTTIELMLRRKSIRKYTDQMPIDQVDEGYLAQVGTVVPVVGRNSGAAVPLWF